ncbi:2716_t:CDS:2 [Entrophospora sp. SA101]|nr:2716_t:CDS:2 [Entrophospora sp. SA101]
MVKTGNGTPNCADTKISIPREDLTPLPTTICLVEPTPEIPVNAAAQKKVANRITMAEKKLTEFEQICNFATDSQLRHDMHVKIADLQAQIKSNKEKILKLKRNAECTQKWKEKKQKLLLESQEVILYDKPGHPPLLFKHPDLHDHIHDSVEFGSADEKQTTLLQEHHHPAWVAVAGVSHAETRDHPNGHYCLASVKCAKQFATVFADMSVVISQDDKAKIGLGVPAVGRTFHTLQSVHEPVCVADHDFPVGSGQELVPSVYLMIKPNESNDELRTGQLAIFVCRQWSLGTPSHTHMQDLESLTLDPQYDDVLKTNGEIRPIWMLLVNGGPDENPRHLKNIKTYCQLFQKFDLDYLTVRTHAPGQSKYNPVERGMATLSGKFAGITLPIDHFGTHLNTQGKVINPDLALQNFRYAGEALCNIWRHDLIFRKSVDAQYIEELVNPFENLQFEDLVLVNVIKITIN